MSHGACVVAVEERDVVDGWVVAAAGAGVGVAAAWAVG